MNNIKFKNDYINDLFYEIDKMFIYYNILDENIKNKLINYIKYWCEKFQLENFLYSNTKIYLKE